MMLKQYSGSGRTFVSKNTIRRKYFAWTQVLLVFHSDKNIVLCVIPKGGCIFFKTALFYIKIE